jgi:predicted SAM-dependent methyltransferase
MLFINPILKIVDMENEIRIDLACGDRKKEGFVGVDIAETDSVDIIHDLNVYPWPFEDNSVDEVNCSHYIEHIPHLTVQSALKQSNSFDEFKILLLNDKDGLIKFFNELYRILKPEGKAKLIAPYYTSERAYGDATHQRNIADSTCWYLNKDWVEKNKLKHYGLNCNFEVTLSYVITNEMTLKSEEVRSKAFLHDWNVISDIIIDLVKK